MRRKRNRPNLENCTLEELGVASKAWKIQTTDMRLMAFKALIMVCTHQQVVKVFGVNKDSVARWVRRFNHRDT